MTALCGGGTSSAKSGVAETIIFTTSALASLLNNKGGYWATLAAPLLGVLAYSATELCSTDPPAQPTFSASDYSALLLLSPWDDLTTALSKLADLVKIAVWYEMCQCNAVATPLPPAGLLNPPAGVTAPTYSGGACPQPRGRFNVPIEDSSTELRAHTNVTRYLWPSLPTETSVATPGFPATDIVRVPPEWSAIWTQLQLVSGNAPSSGNTYAFRIDAYGPDRTVTSTPVDLGVYNGLTSAKSPPSNPLTLNKSTQLYLSAKTWRKSTLPEGVVDVAIETTCSTAPAVANACCTDPALLALLGQVLELVTLVQRQQVPFAYVPGTAHAGLTGTGELAVQGLIGAKVALGALPPNVGVEDGTPGQTFDAGWISWGNADGFGPREWIHASQLVSLPAAAGQYTRLGYTLAVGVTAAITELVREP